MRLMLIAFVLLCLAIPGFSGRDIKVEGRVFKDARFELVNSRVRIVHRDGVSSVDPMKLEKEDLFLFLPMEVMDVMGRNYGLCQLVYAMEDELLFKQVGMDKRKADYYKLSSKMVCYTIRNGLGLDGFKTRRIEYPSVKPATRPAGSLPIPK